ncbi:GATOR complex protein WDR24-like, partial [Haliotis rubra]|uniref:GATOR complex protein WDR24-like n=1 Tax=Haliotis rubra TaxID=36100 RepID=UPI001EE57922
NILASAATNGSVVIWDLNRPSRLKQEHVFADHKRSVNRVNFHSGEHQLLISGSQDGNVILFDVRKKSVSSRFVAKGSESVRDVQFCPNSYFTFGATYDNGNVQIWDMRRPDRYESVFTAHSGPVFSHDWHPEDKNWMATAGRDKLIRLQQVAQIWGLLKMMFGPTTQTLTHVSKLVQSSGDKQDAEKGSLKQMGASKPLAKSSSEMIGNKDSDIEKTATEMTSGNSDDSSDSESSEPREMTDIASGLASKHTGDFFFGDGEQDVLGFSIDYVSRLEKPEKDWTLPSEAFQPRHEISDRTTPPEQMESRHDSLISSGNATDIITRTVPSESEEQDFLLAVSKIPNMSSLNSKNCVAQLLRDFAEQGDVQTPVSVLLVLGDRVRSVIEEQTQENWFHCYIEMLGRYKLWSKANEIIKLSHVPQVKYLNQESTTINTLCARCNRGLQQNRWLCERCRVAANLCSICHHPVKGLFAWCQGCCHGGHLQHMKEWLETSKYCPTGCGHRCEYS